MQVVPLYVASKEHQEAAPEPNWGFALLTERPRGPRVRSSVQPREWRSEAQVLPRPWDFLYWTLPLFKRHAAIAAPPPRHRRAPRPQRRLHLWGRERARGPCANAKGHFEAPTAHSLSKPGMRGIRDLPTSFLENGSIPTRVPFWCGLHVIGPFVHGMESGPTRLSSLKICGACGWPLYIIYTQ